MEVVLLKTLSALTRKSPKLMTFMALAWTFESTRRRHFRWNEKSASRVRTDLVRPISSWASEVDLEHNAACAITLLAFFDSRPVVD
jgi:hypothetical protein